MRVRVYSLLQFFTALSYGVLLGFVLPFEGFKDRINYLNYVAHSSVILQRYYRQGLTALLSNEPLWLLLNIYLEKVFSPVMVVRVIIFVSAFITAWSFFKIAKNKQRCYKSSIVPFLWLFLVSPPVITQYIISIRQGLAIAIFLLGWSVQNQKVRWFFMSLTPFVHSSFFIVLLIYFSIYILRLARWSPGGRIFFAFIEGILVGFSLKHVARLLQARQAFEYEFYTTKVSGLGFLFWLAILVLMYLECSNFLRQHVFEISSIIFYLSTYFFLEVTARIFGCVLPLILLSGLDLTRWRRRVFLVLMMLFTLAVYLMRISEPRLGFGV